ncbi:MAG TPA: exopolysaccharide transport family protein [Pseudolabrys sp.]|nr:exopolysaccharide transport family protein [Pseudolabrys sp.]
MFFRKKSKAGAPPSVATPVAVMPATAMNASGEPDLRGLASAVWQKKTRIIAFTLIAAAGAFVVVNAITPRYRSESKLLLESRENVFMRAEADKNTTDRSTIDPEAVTSQMQIMLSRDLARGVIAKEKLNELPEFDPAIGGLTPLRTLLGLFGMARDVTTLSRDERTLEAFYDRLNVHAVEKSRVIGIDFSSADPQLAARVANTISETYLSMQRSAKTDQTRAASTWLAGEIDKMRTKVAESEGKVEAYRARSNLFVGSNNTSLPNQQLTEVNSQIAAARGQKADLEARAKQLRELVRSGQPIDSSDIANSESMRRLTEQGNALRSQLAEQSTTLLDQHPRIKELRAQIAEIERAKRVEGERLARQLENDAKVAGDRLQAMMVSLDQVKKLASQTNEQDVELRSLERDAKSQRELLDSYLVKYSEASARDNINAAPPEARIISRASPAIKPAYPKKTSTVLIAAFAAFILSAGFTVTGALLATPGTAGFAPVYPQGIPSNYPAPVGYRTPPAYTPPMQQPLPYMASPPIMPAAQFAVPVALSSIDQIVQSIKQAGEGGRRVVVAGTKRNVGTTHAAITLARALAKSDTVVLVDMAFGAPNLSVISTDPNAPGLAELARGAATFGDIVTRDQFSNVHVVAAGNIGADGLMLASSPMMQTAIEALTQSYGHVVIDIGSVADVPVERFAALAQKTVLVASDPVEAASKNACDRLAMAGFGDVSLMAGATQAAAA